MDPLETQRERILAVYRGETPDVVPFVLDLSHWFCHKRQSPWDLSVSYEKPEYDLIDYHKSAGAGFCIPNFAAFYSVCYPTDVLVETEKGEKNGVAEIVWRITTPLGIIERSRIWEDGTYAWGISRWGIRNEKDVEVFAYALSNRSYEPLWERYETWRQYVGDHGVVYLLSGYSAMGQLLNYWMGVESTMYATVDFPAALHEAIDSVNDNNLELVNLLCECPAEIILMGDNFSGDIQPPTFFDEWSRPYYEEAIRRFHDCGKFVAVHIDGRLRGAIEMIRSVGADCGDAITPTPMGDLSPAECRAAAGNDFILSGGVSPNLWLPEVSVEVFEAKVVEWLEQKRHTSRFIAGAGDQVPPGADESRIMIMRNLVEKHGRY